MRPYYQKFNRRYQSPLLLVAHSHRQRVVGFAFFQCLDALEGAVDLCRRQTEIAGKVDDAGEHGFVHLPLSDLFRRLVEVVEEAEGRRPLVAALVHTEQRFGCARCWRAPAAAGCCALR